MIQKLQRVINVLLLTIVLAIGFCAPSYAVVISNIDWKLTSLHGSSPVEKSPITITFDGIDTGIFLGSGGCNSYSGGWKRDNSGQITIGNISSTKMSCGEEIDRQEKQYFQVLKTVTTYSTDGTTLSLTNPNQKITLEFSKS